MFSPFFICKKDETVVIDEVLDQTVILSEDINNSFSMKEGVGMLVPEQKRQK